MKLLVITYDIFSLIALKMPGNKDLEHKCWSLETRMMMWGATLRDKQFVRDLKQLLDSYEDISDMDKFLVAGEILEQKNNLRGGKARVRENNVSFESTDSTEVLSVESLLRDTAKGHMAPEREEEVVDFFRKIRLSLLYKYALFGEVFDLLVWTRTDATVSFKADEKEIEIISPGGTRELVSIDYLRWVYLCRRFAQVIHNHYGDVRFSETKKFTGGDNFVCNVEAYFYRQHLGGLSETYTKIDEVIRPH